MEVNKSHIIVGCGALVIGCVVGFLLRGCSGEESTDPIIIHDTITETDTAYIERHTKVTKVLPPDTIWIHTTDTTTDSIFVEIPMEQKEYRDTFKTDSSNIELAVQFSGYKAKIDSVGLNYRFEIQPKIVKEKKGWGFFVGPSIQVGYGVGLGNPVITAPYIGVGVSLGWGYHFK